MSVSTLAAVNLLYFGKIPSRGDFIRSASSTALIKLMDRWVSQGLEALAQDAHWKALYDQAPPVHFAFLSLGSAHGLAGHLLPSADQSGRRFPLVTAGAFDVGQPQAFMRRAPLVVQPLWAELAQISRRLHDVNDPAPLLQELSLRPRELDTDPRSHDAGFHDFLDVQTVGSVQGLLRDAGHDVDLRLSLLGLGLLLESVPARGQQPIDKGLCLPLPARPEAQMAVAAWWLDLVSRFLKHRTDLELSVYLPQSAGAVPCPVLFLGFSGGAAVHFSALFDPRTVPAAFVDIRRSAWAEAHAEASYGARKLSSYLRQPQLSLRQAHRTFCEAFLGE